MRVSKLGQQDGIVLSHKYLKIKWRGKREKRQKTQHIEAFRFWTLCKTFHSKFAVRKKISSFRITPRYLFTPENLFHDTIKRETFSIHFVPSSN